jgi:serine/threonine protein phosphatase PrpC
MALVDGFLGVPDFFMLSLFDGHAGTDSAEYAARQYVNKQIPNKMNQLQFITSGLLTYFPPPIQDPDGHW